jgi:transposase
LTTSQVELVAPTPRNLSNAHLPQIRAHELFTALEREIAELVAQIAGAQRFATPAKLARTAGVAPIPASSGNTQRQRLDQVGDRQINVALHRVIVTRARCHPQTRDYIARRAPLRLALRARLRAGRRDTSNWPTIQPAIALSHFDPP